jgi:hypothetical protein
MSTTAVAIDPKELLVRYLERTAESYLINFACIPQDKLGVSPMGVARTALEFTAECGGFNGIAADVVRGADVDMPSEDERQAFYASVDTAEKGASLIRSSVDELILAIEEADEAALNRRIVAPWGEPVTPYILAHIAASHMAYHDGQLAYIQSLYGDGEIHAC